MIYFIVGFIVGGIASTILWFILADIICSDDEDKIYPDE